jgi:hypothetical protein
MSVLMMGSSYPCTRIERRRLLDRRYSRGHLLWALVAATMTVGGTVALSPNPKAPAVLAILYFHPDYIRIFRCHAFSPTALGWPLSLHAPMLTAATTQFI